MIYDLDLVFRALSDGTRRAMLQRLADSDLTVGELAEPVEMSPQAVSQHLATLERAGLVVRTTDAQWRVASLDPRPLQHAQRWIAQFDRFWA